MAWGIPGIEPTSAFATAGSLIHPRHYAQGSQAFLKTLSDAKARHERRHEIETTSDWENWYRHVESNRDNVLVAQMPEGGEKRFEGRSIAEIAKMSGKDVWNAFFDLVQSGEVSVNPKSMNEEQKQLALRSEFISFCTDSEPMDIAKAANAHPCAFGSYPDVLAKYVREDKVITLEMPVCKMTSLPANCLKHCVWNRGWRGDGSCADSHVRKLPYTALRDAILTHPTMAEGLTVLFAAVSS